MNIQMKRAFVGKELKDLLASEKQLFLKSDRGDSASYWKGTAPHWIMDGDINVGRIDVCPNMRFTDGEDWSRTEGWLYVSSFGLIRNLQETGFDEIGPEVVKWLFKYAIDHGLKYISTNEREKTSAKLIELYKSHDFRELCRTPDYFTDPDELCVVLECKIP